MKLKMSREVDLGKEPIGHLLLILALPSITSQVVNALYNMVDRMYIGHIPEIGSAALTGTASGVKYARAAKNALTSAARQASSAMRFCRRARCIASM